jgi:hypothetical protein
MVKEKYTEESSCAYKNQSQPIRVCIRWVHQNYKLHYIFIGTHAINLRDILIKLEKNIELTQEERAEANTVLGDEILKLSNVRFIHRSIFIDDTRLQVLYKTVQFIKEYYVNRMDEFPALEYRALSNISFLKRKDLPMAWTYRQAWLFQVDKSWSQWKANPWLYDLKNNDFYKNLFQSISKTPTHDYIGDELALNHTLNFTFPSDYRPLELAPELIHWYTLWNDDVELSSIEQLNYEESRLTELWNYPRTSQSSNMVQLEKCFIQEYHETGTFHLKETFKEIFDKIPISSYMPFIQWVGDKYHILYRLYKQHTLEESVLEQLIDINKITHESRLTLLIQIQHTPVYIKWILEQEGHYYIHVKMGGYPIQIHKIHDAISKTKTDLQKLFKLKLTYSESDVRAKLMLKYVPTISNTSFFQELSKYGWLYSVKEKELRQQRVKLMYLRSMTSHQRVRPEEFIRAQMMFIENDEELLTILEETFGLSSTKASEWLQHYRTSDQWMESLPSDKFKKWVQIPSFITITRNGQNIQAQCERFANMEDIYRMAHWLQGTFMDIGIRYQQSSSKTPSVPPPKEKPAIPEKKKVEIPKDISFSSSSESAPSSVSSRSTSSSMVRTESSSFGGGGYDLNEELKQADPTIFKDTTLPNNPSRYPRLCSANTNQQPIVVSQEDMKRIDEGDFKNAYDNKLLYGSDKDVRKHKYYFCPRIWCPISKVPMTYDMLQSDTYKGKCPGPHFEEPWMMYDTNYWGKDPNKTHYIGFHSKQGTNGLCLPCCKINGHKNQDENPMWKKCSAHIKREKEKPETPSIPPEEKPEPPGPKKRGRKAKVDKDDKEEYYLLHFDPPISANRWGVLPESLHQLVSPHQSYTSCYTQLKSDNPCLVRKGIHHHKDSFMNAVGYLLTGGKGGKRELIDLMLQHITPFEFLTLENGWWIMSLIDKEPILPQLHLEEVLQWKKWIQAYPKYVSTLQLQSIVDMAGASLELSTVKQLRLSRELAIYRAWKRFWNYIKSNEPKELHLMYDLLRCLGVHLIVWEKTSPEKVYLRCPLPTSMNDIYTTLYDTRLPYIMLMHENNHYEPIELKSRGAEGITLLDDSELVHRLNQLRHQCGDSGTTFLQKYTLLFTLPKTIFQDVKEWSIKSLVLGPNLSIFGVLLHSDIYVYWKQPIPLKYLSELTSILRVSKVVYFEDISISAKRIWVSSNQVAIFMKLLQHLEMRWNVSNVEENVDSPSLSQCTLTPVADERPSIIPTVTMNHLDETLLRYDTDYRHWIRLQKIVGSRLLKNYTSIVQPILSLEKSEQFERLEKLFQSIPYSKKIRIILEEIPYASRDALHEWYVKIGSQQMYPFYSSILRDGRSSKEWIFSQSALRGGAIDWRLPELIRKPSKVMHPPTIPMEPVKTLLKSYEMTKKPAVTYPITKSSMEWNSLPSKWLIMKKYDWQDYKLCTSKETGSFEHAWVWLANEYKTPISKELFQLAHQLKVASMIEQDDIDILNVYLQDPSVWRGLAKQMNMEKSKSTTIIKHYLRLPKQEQWDQWLRYYTSKHAKPVDLDLWLFANLTNSVVLMMHRSPSGIGVDTTERNRFEDFISSATVYHNDVLALKDLNDKPLVVFYKKSKLDSEYSQYDWVVYKETQFYFKKIKDAPKILGQLIEAVIKAQKQSK